MLLRVAIAALLLSPAPVADVVDVVDGVVAVVGDQPVMLSSVVFEHEVRTVMDGGGRLVNLGPPQLDCGVFADVIERTLVLQQAEGEILGVDEEANWQPLSDGGFLAFRNFKPSTVCLDYLKVYRKE